MAWDDFIFLANRNDLELVWNDCCSSELKLLGISVGYFAAVKYITLVQIRPPKVAYPRVLELGTSLYLAQKKADIDKKKERNPMANPMAYVARKKVLQTKQQRYTDDFGLITLSQLLICFPTLTLSVCSHVGTAALNGLRSTSVVLR